MSTYPFTEDLRERMTGNMRAFDRLRARGDGLRRAAVTLVVAERAAGGACLLLTRRPKGMRRHAGQYALPGGRLDPGETFEAAALRELTEELGLMYGEDRIVGALDDYVTRSGFCIRPFVVWGGPLDELRPDPEEVAKVFQIPLDEFDHPAIPELTPGECEDTPIIGLPLATLGHAVHAPTAAMMYQFREVAMHGRATRVAHFGEPAFAWK